MTSNLYHHPRRALDSSHADVMSESIDTKGRSVHSALLIRPREAARLLAISERSLWAFTQSGEIPFIRIGRSVRYCPADLAAWIAGRKKPAIVDRSAPPGSVPNKNSSALQ
jgi:excisionase family DNA binding protein